MLVDNEKAKEAALKAMAANPSGCMVFYSKRSISATYWTDKDQVAEETLALNMISGVVNQLLSGKKTTLSRVIKYLEATNAN